MIYGRAVRAFSFAFVAIGVAVLVRALIAGAGPNSVGLLIGIAFVAVGALRLWVSSRMGR